MLLTNYIEKELIYESPASIIYKAISKENNKPVIIKILNDEYPSEEKLARFKYEYEILSNLNLQGVIKVYSLEKYQNSLAIIEEDFGGIALKHCKIDRTNLVSLLSLFIQITEILGKLQEEKINHKDMNYRFWVIDKISTGKIRNKKSRCIRGHTCLYITRTNR